MPGYYFSFWRATRAPKGTPKDIIAKLDAAGRATRADANTRKRLTPLAQDPFPPDQQTPETLSAFQKSTIEKTALDHQGRRPRGGIRISAVVTVGRKRAVDRRRVSAIGRRRDDAPPAGAASPDGGR